MVMTETVCIKSRVDNCNKWNELVHRGDSMFYQVDTWADPEDD